MDKNELYNLLIRYIDGEATTEEAGAMEELMLTDAWLKNEFEILNTLNKQIPFSLNYSVDAQTNANWEALKSQIELPAKTIKLWPSLAKYAAAAAIIFVAGWFLLKSSANEFSSFDTGQIYKTLANQTLKVYLADGTEIMLNENSELTIDNAYNSKNRLVELKGEAYFEVTQNPSKPFITKTKNTFTKVLGTSFEIESLNENLVLVSLYEGKVLFSSGNQKVELKPGQKITYTLKNKSIAKQTFINLAKDTWVAGLSFKDTKLIDIAKKLEIEYAIKIIIPASKQNENYTVSFEGLDLNASLKLLEELTDSKITKKDSEYILNP